MTAHSFGRSSKPAHAMDAAQLAIAALDAAGAEAMLVVGGSPRVLTTALRARLSATRASELAAQVTWHARRDPSGDEPAPLPPLRIAEGRLQVIAADASATDSPLLAILIAAGGATIVTDPVARLTPQQLRVAQLVAGGATTTEVARRLVLSVKTVRRHLEAVHVRLGIRRRAELVQLFADRADPPLQASA
ncbi:MAG: helix-turn-helix transcriptional regulator [Gemmatimonadetes bacterium]|nr:helix-turn-helix transcriptional regulator [Gemmatimonadota bacterium]